MAISVPVYMTEDIVKQQVPEAHCSFSISLQCPSYSGGHFYVN